MTEDILLGPRAHGVPCGRAVLKATPEDFRVDEVLDIALSGTGEHLWLWIEKRQCNTEEVARHLAKAFGVPLRAISYAGLKDRQALTRQWFSIHLAGQPNPDPALAETAQIRILELSRHSRKLQRGAHAANRFSIRLTECDAPESSIKERCRRIAQLGVPNYFGLQRFGIGGQNLKAAEHYAAQGTVPEQRTRRSRVLSAARSYLFNQLLAQRVAQGTWNQALVGDALSFTQSHSFFVAHANDTQDVRLATLDVHPTGALWGAGALPTLGAVQSFEAHWIETQHRVLADWLVQAGLTHERRILRLPIQALTWHYPSPRILHLDFVLPTGCFATAVLRELVTLTSPTDISCAF